MESTAPKDRHAAWQPGPWQRRLFTLLQWILAFAGGVALFAGATVAVKRGFDGHVLVALAIGWPLLYVNIALHEFGHAVAARRAGMHVLRAQIGLVELVARRRGWDWRWKRPVLKVDGLVAAFPCSRRPVRAQYLAMVIGGPLANVLTALGVGIAAALLWPRPLAWLAAGFALHAAVLGLANLLPSMTAQIGSDGLQLLHLLRGQSAQGPGIEAFTRLNGLSIEGVTADKLPPDLLLALDADPAIAPARPWFEAWAAQLRGDWDGVLAAQAEAEARIGAGGGAHWAPVAAVLQTLAALARALRDGRADRRLDAALPDDFDFYEPGLRHACRAMHAALVGDRTGRAHWLAALRRDLGRNRDLAAAASLARLADAIEAFVPAAEPAPVAVFGEGDAAAAEG